MNWLFDLVMPPLEGSPKQKAWEWKVSIMLFVGGAALLYGGARVAWAKDMETKITDAMKPVKEQLDKQAKAQDTMSRLLLDSLASTKAGQIRLVVSKRCKTLGTIEREALNTEIDRLQGEYKDLKGERYIAPTCGEL